MGVNNDAKKLSTISKTAVTGLNPGEIKAWFVIEHKDNHFFYVDPKISDPNKFKEPKVIKKFLAKHNIPGSEKIDDKAPLICGTLCLGKGVYEMVIALKKNGAGKSTLKNIAKDAVFKKIVSSLEIVTSHSDLGNIALTEAEITKKVAEENAHAKEAKELQDEAVSLKLNEKEIKALQMHKWSVKDVPKFYQANMGTLENETFFQDALRRLKKFQKAEMYELFEEKWWIQRKLGFNNPLSKYAKEFLLTKKKLPTYIARCELMLNGIEKLKGNIDPEEAALDLFDAPVTTAINEFSTYLESKGFNEDDASDILVAFGVDGKEDFMDIFKLCNEDSSEMKYLLDTFGGMDWKRLQSNLHQIELALG